LPESNGLKFCAQCGCGLECSLLEGAIDDEITHYRENGVATDGNPQSAFDLRILINAVLWGHERADEVMNLTRQFMAGVVVT
jgi:hypothetical protein